MSYNFTIESTILLEIHLFDLNLYNLGRKAEIARDIPLKKASYNDLHMSTAGCK